MLQEFLVSLGLLLLHLFSGFFHFLVQLRNGIGNVLHAARELFVSDVGRSRPSPGQSPADCPLLNCDPEVGLREQVREAPRESTHHGSTTETGSTQS